MGDRTEGDDFEAEWRRLHRDQSSSASPEADAELEFFEEEGELGGALAAPANGDDPPLADPPVEPATTSHQAKVGDEGVDELLASLGLATDAADVGGGDDGGRHSPRSPLLPPSISGALIGALATALVVSLGVIVWLLVSDGGDGTSIVASQVGESESALDEEVQDLFDTMGLDRVDVMVGSGGIVLSGTAETRDQLRAAVGALDAIAPGVEVDTSGVVISGEETSALGREQDQPAGTEGGDGQALSRDQTVLQSDLNRITASTPLIFGVGESELSDLQLRVLNSIATAMSAYPDVEVTVVGYTDTQGDPDANEQLSLLRATKVKDYLVSQGISGDRLLTAGSGEMGSTGSAGLANLERRVEFRVGAPGGPGIASNDELLRIAIVAPSAANDVAFTQSMVDAVNMVADERGNTEVSITDNTFVPDDAAAAIADYAEQGYDLVIAHGVQFGAELIEIVGDHPDTTFAWGNSEETFDLPNLYAYTAAAEEGAYVMGAMSALLSSSGVIGVVSPIEVGDAGRYVDGFQAGAVAEDSRTSVPVTFTGSFSDIGLAAEAAEGHVADRADVLTGSSQMVVGAISVAGRSGALWFGTQANQESLAPDIVVASQVYHWEVALRAIVTDIDNGTVNGRAQEITLANGGLVIEYNQAYDLPASVRSRADELTRRIIAGSVSVPVTG